MSELDHSPEEPSSESSGDSRRPLIIVGAAVVLLVAGAIGWWLMRPAPVAPGEPRQAERPAPRPEAPAPPAPAPETPPAEAPRETRVRPRPAPKPVTPVEPAPEAPPAPARELTIDTDVPGALVFLDRKYLGNAPVKTSDVTAGSHQVNVSAEGYDGVAQTIQVAEEGATSVTISLKEVRLNEVVEVVHKHAMGSCQGKLTATLNGFRYTPTKGNDGFSMSLAAVESFEIDYMKKNLRLKQKGGKTYNFESPTGSADPLFVFHRDVEKARLKLAK